MTLPRVIFDTNVLLVSVSSRSPYHWAYRAVVDGHVTLCLSTGIALEYDEILSSHMGGEAADDVLSFLETASNVEWVRAAYQWRLISSDPDDDKFVDCAVASGATIVTEDRHFDVLHGVGFPPVRVIGIKEFRHLLDLTKAPF